MERGGCIPNARKGRPPIRQRPAEFAVITEQDHAAGVRANGKRGGVALAVQGVSGAADELAGAADFPAAAVFVSDMARAGWIEGHGVIPPPGQSHLARVVDVNHDILGAMHGNADARFDGNERRHRAEHGQRGQYPRWQALEFGKVCTHGVRAGGIWRPPATTRCARLG